jgi:N-acetylmuramoyl-L-alanine amidase
MKLPFRAARPSNLTILMIGLNAIALMVLTLVLVDQFSGTPAAAAVRTTRTVPRAAATAQPESRSADVSTVGSAAAPAGGFPLPKPWFKPLSGPLRVAIQAGHWKNDELPRELRHLIGVSGAEVQHVEEYVINKAVADALARRLERAGIEAEVLPATVPPDLRADLFLAIHCDWADRSKNHGWKVSPPDKPSKASQRLSDALAASFAVESSIRRDVARISDNMYDYYAFNAAKYEHSIDPLTPAAIVELGFMSNPAEFKRLRREPDWWAGILERGLRSYLATTPRNNPILLMAPP